MRLNTWTKPKVERVVVEMVGVVVEIKVDNNNSKCVSFVLIAKSIASVHRVVMPSVVWNAVAA